MAAGIYLLNGPQLAICHVPLSERRRELHAVPGRERAVRFSIERHPLQPARIVGYLLASGACDRQAIVLCMHLIDPRVLARADGEDLTAGGVANHVAWLVLLGPLAVRAGDLLSCHQNAHALLVVVHLTCGLHQTVDDL